MIRLDDAPSPESLRPALERAFERAGHTIASLDREYDDAQGSPVYTVKGKYATRGWTEWTEGFRYGIALLHHEATGEARSLESGRRHTVERMATHVSHIGVHDHGFNNLSTYGNLRRMMLEGTIADDEWERRFYEMAIKASGAAQAARWTRRRGGGGFIYSFNGPHSLFVDTVRSVRILMLADRLGHVLMGEGDRPISLLERGLEHLRSTREFSVFHGEGRDRYDAPGRVVHECLFNTNDGAYRCPSAQQGYSPFTTWTRGQSWAILGFAEELEFLETLDEAALAPHGGKAFWRDLVLNVAIETAENFIENTPADGISYWDQGAPNLHRLGDYLDRPADPFNAWEPVDSSASAITAQGLLRLGRHFLARGDKAKGNRFERAGLVAARSLLSEPYLSGDPNGQGILLHTIYHHPNGWDHRPDPDKAPYGESCMWGDYHLMELALYLKRRIDGRPDLTFFGPPPAAR